MRFFIAFQEQDYYFITDYLHTFENQVTKVKNKQVPELGIPLITRILVGLLGVSVLPHQNILIHFSFFKFVFSTY